MHFSVSALCKARGAYLSHFFHRFLLLAKHLRDFRGDDLDMGEEAKPEVKLLYESEAAAYVAGLAVEKSAKGKKWYRLTHRDFLLALDKSTMTACGWGLKRFEFKQMDVDIDKLTFGPEADGLHPILTIALDQGPQSFPALAYLIFKLNLMLWFTFDISHREWNDAKSAYISVGLWPLVLLLIIAINLDFGPFEGTTWWNKGFEGIVHFVKKQF